MGLDRRRSHGIQLLGRGEARRALLKLTTALSAGEAERMEGRPPRIVKLAAEHLGRAEQGHAEVLAEVAALREELQGFRTQIGFKIGVTLERPRIRVPTCWLA